MPRSHAMTTALLLGATAFGHAAPGRALDRHDSASATETGRCHAIEDERQRLSCYDRATGRNASLGTSTLAEAERGAAPDRLRGKRGAPNVADGSVMTAHWELDDASHGGLFQIRPHNPVYALPVRYSTRPNDLPRSPAPGRSLDQALGLDDIEAKFQISLKTKALDNLLDQNLDLWFGYTQLSSWQAYNGVESSPFRETNYQPEVFLSHGVDLGLFGGWRWRMTNLGVVHESNGRSQPRSRSWNRIYLQFGLERVNLSIHARPWWRIAESGDDDDNPDIKQFMGSHDLRLVYRRGDHDFALLTRYSFEGERGGLQADWHFPLIGQLKGYLQLTTGFGETLIDYNHRQTTLGVGVSMVEAR